MYEIITGSVSHFKKGDFYVPSKVVEPKTMCCVCLIVLEIIGFFSSNFYNNKQKKTTKNSNKSTCEEGSHKVQKKSFCRRSQKV